MTRSVPSARDGADSLVLGRLHVVTDTRAGRRPLEAVAGALAGGAPVIQVRAKGCTDRELYDLALRVAAACREHGALCVVDDRPDIALAVGADGTHLGAHDLPVAAARRVAGAGHLLGGTARDVAQGRALVAAGATYLGVGPAYATTTKDGLPAPLGAAAVGEVAAGVQVPVIAIGGITAERVPELLAAGVHGVAVVGAVSDAADPSVATRRLLAALGAGPR
jgi:thiamine-phosphate pyrophosphorylase